MQQTKEKPANFYTPMVHITKNGGVDISDVCIDEQTQYQVRDTSTGEEYYSAFIKHAGAYLIQPLERLFGDGRFKRIGDAVQVTPDMKIIGTVTAVYEIYRVPTAFEYDNMVRGTEAANNA